MPVTTSPDGTDIHYRHFGGDGPPLLFAHATGFCGELWSPLSRELTSHFSCWTLDFRAHGRSGVPDAEGYAWVHVAQDAMAVIDAVAPDERWFGAGHSMGGAALLMAEQARPGLLAGLWAYEPIVMPPEVRAVAEPLESNPLSDAARRRRPSFESRQAARDNYASKPPLNSFDPEVLDLYVHFGMLEQPDGSASLACRPENEAVFYLMGGRHPTFDLLGKTMTTATIVRGETVAATPSEMAAAIARSLPHGRLEEHPSLSHFGPMEAPKDMALSIRESFLGAAQ